MAKDACDLHTKSRVWETAAWLAAAVVFVWGVRDRGLGLFPQWIWSPVLLFGTGGLAGYTWLRLRARDMQRAEPALTAFLVLAFGLGFGTWTTDLYPAALTVAYVCAYAAVPSPLRGVTRLMMIAVLATPMMFFGAQVGRFTEPATYAAVATLAYPIWQLVHWPSFSEEPASASDRVRLLRAPLWPLAGTALAFALILPMTNHIRSPEVIGWWLNTAQWIAVLAVGAMVVAGALWRAPYRMRQELVVVGFALWAWMGLFSPHPPAWVVLLPILAHIFVHGFPWRGDTHLSFFLLLPVSVLSAWDDMPAWLLRQDAFLFFAVLLGVALWLRLGTEGPWRQVLRAGLSLVAVADLAVAVNVAVAAPAVGTLGRLVASVIMAMVVAALWLPRLRYWTWDAPDRWTSWARPRLGTPSG